MKKKVEKTVGKIVPTNTLKVGDVIMSPDFVYFKRISGSGKPAKLDNLEVKKIVDKKRANKEYLIVDIQETFPGVSKERAILAKELNKDGSYNDKGEGLCFSDVENRWDRLGKVILVRHIPEKKVAGEIVPTNTLKVGDVIMSPDFVYCERRPGSRLSEPATFNSYKSHECERVKEERASREYVVLEDKFFGGGGDTMFNQGPGPSYVKIFAKELRKNGSYNQKGEVICFSRDDGVIHYLRKVRLVRRMKMTFK